VRASCGEIVENLEAHLSEIDSGEIAVEFELIYFNSSTAKVLMGLLDTLEETAEAGISAAVNWHDDAEDDIMEELGEEFAEDMGSATSTWKSWKRKEAFAILHVSFGSNSEVFTDRF